MTAARFPLILEMKVAGLVEEFMRRTGVALDAALTTVYHSQVYRTLATEETKLWHHSPRLLLECLTTELRTGTPEYPDE